MNDTRYETVSVIKKKCKSCGFLHAPDHVGDCEVEGPGFNKFIFICELHPTLQLDSGASICPECATDQEEERKDEENRKR